MKKSYFHLLLTVFIIFAFLSSVNNIYSQKEKKPQYIGVKKCAPLCHNKAAIGEQYNIWQKSLHAKAFTTLASPRAKLHAESAKVKDNPQENTVCLKCHTAGGGQDESSFAVTYSKEEGVTCEACHGPGSIYKSISIMRDREKFLANGGILPKEKDCLKCHNDSVHTMHEFNFAEKWKIIAHPIPKK